MSKTQQPRSWLKKLGAFGRPLRFASVGVLNSATDFFVFLALTTVLANAAVANIISYSCGAVVSYTLNRNWTFRSDGPTRDHRSAIALFILLTVVMVAISTVMTVVAAFVLPLPMAKLVSIVVVAGLSYLGLGRLVFAPQSGQRG